MPETSSERRLAENEVVFRQLNEQVLAGHDETNWLAHEDAQPEFLIDTQAGGQPQQFYCECADETCGDRVTINVHDYEDIHRHRARFTIVPGHEVEAIEEIILEQPEYTVVQKHDPPPESADSLHPSAIDNN